MALISLLPTFAPTLPHLGAHVVLGYIDPGTGSMMFQMLLAGILSAGVAFKSVRQRIATAWQSLRKPAIPADPPGAGGEPPTPGDSAREG
jgi:hypothetical protein